MCKLPRATAPAITVALVLVVWGCSGDAIDDLEVGDCFRGGPAAGGDESSTVDRASCDEPGSVRVLALPKDITLCPESTDSYLTSDDQDYVICLGAPHP